MKAITTRYVGATERRPARIIASDMDGNRITLPADGDFPYDTAHHAAAVTLCERMQWTGAETLVGGSVKHGMVWVFPDPTPTRSRAGNPRCGDEQTDTDHTYTCTLPAGHDGAHVMTTHPLHPTWAQA